MSQIGFLMLTLADFTNEELEEAATAHIDSIRALMTSYAVVFEEGVDRRIPTFLRPEINLLSDDERQPVACYVKSLPDDQLVDAVIRYKEMPTCLKITLNEIKRRLKEKP